MKSSIIGRRCAAVSVLLGFLGAGSAWGADEPNQTLDQVDAFSATKVLEMAFDRPPPPFSELALGSPAGLAACKLAASGLYCLASSAGVQVVRQWKLPLTLPDGSPVDRFSCAAAALGLDGGTCTGLTADISGAIWVSGQKGTSYSLFKLVKAAILPGGCTNGWVSVTGAQPAPLCAREFATGPGTLSDLDAVDGEVAYSSTAPNLIEPGILALNRGSSDASLYFDLFSPGLLHSFPNWNLQAGERLLSTTLLQRTQTVSQVTSVVGNYILAATTGGRILSIDFSTPSATASPVFTIPQGQPPITINASSCTSGTTTCTVGAATLSSAKPFYVKPPQFGFSGLGLNGNTQGEIAVNENVHVQFQGPDPYTVTAIQIVYLFNGPEYGDRAEIARITVDGSTPYTLTMSNTADNGDATWSAPGGSVTKCSPPTSSGAGCFLITNPFPAPVSALDFAAVHSTVAGFGGTTSNDSDFAIGKIEAQVDYGYGIRTSFKTGRVYASDRNAKNVRALVPGAGTNYLLTQLLPVSKGILSTSPTAPDALTVAPGNSIDLSQCPDATQKCIVILAADGTSAATVDSVKLKDGSPTGVTVYHIKGLIDCRYAPKDCSDLLGVPPIGTPVNDKAYMEGLIQQGIIIPLDPSKPSLAKNRYRPAAQLLNVTPMLPEDVTSLFSETGGLPPLQISRTYRGTALNNFRFDALFYKKPQGQTFIDTLFSDIEVAKLSSTGLELGCQQGNAIPYANLLKLDVVTRVSETERSISDFYRAVANDYRDTITNDGCGGARTKIPGLSLFPFNLEFAPDTYGPQSTSQTQSVTVNNDALFARLVETLYDDLNRSRSQLACTTIDGGPSPPLSSSVCNDLASKWSTGKNLLNNCISSAFSGQSATTTTRCNAFRSQLAVTYAGALPLTAASDDPANRLGEQKARVTTLTRLFDERFVRSILPKGFCREKTAPNGYKGCPAPAW